MDKHSKKSSSLLHYPVLVVFSLFLYWSVRTGPYYTGPRLQRDGKHHPFPSAPALTQLSAKGLNSYFTAYTKYVKDQVFGRDEWISLQSVVETTLLQKEQNGGILLGREHMMFPAPSACWTARTAPCPRTPPLWKHCASATRVR